MAAAAAELENCKAAIRNTLETLNRPFNGTNLVDDLAKDFKKSVTMKALASLSEEKTINVKLFGKNKIYLADQTKFDVPNEAELEALEAEVQTLSSELQGLLELKAAATQRRAQLEATPTDEALGSMVKDLTLRTAAQMEQLNECEKANAAGASDRALAADKGTLDKALQVVSKAGKKRKRVCREAVLELESATEMTKDHLIGAIGIDEDGYYDQLFDDGEL